VSKSKPRHFKRLPGEGAAWLLALANPNANVYARVRSFLMDPAKQIANQPNYSR
jgi:hypothetical protein